MLLLQKSKFVTSIQLSIIFQGLLKVINRLYHSSLNLQQYFSYIMGVSFIDWEKPEYQKKPTDLLLVLHR